MKFSMCADIIYQNMDFCEKLALIKDNGFSTVEFWKWQNKDISGIKSEIQRLDMNVSAFCIGSNEEKVMSAIGNNMLNSANLPELRQAVFESIETAKKLEAKELIATVGDSIDGISFEKQVENVYKNIEAVKNIFETEEITLLIEPINLKERPNYLLPNVKSVADIVKNIGCKNVKLLYDIYHQAAENDFSVENLIELLPVTGHIHIADYPGRHEPGTGNIDYRTVFEELYKNKCECTIGMEYIPSEDEEKSFEKLQLSLSKNHRYGLTTF